MPTNHTTYDRCLDRWDELAHASTSVPDVIGKTALLLPFNHRVRSKSADGESFGELAHSTALIANHLHGLGRHVVDGINATIGDVYATLDDEQISSVILLGHGCMSSVEIASDTAEARVDWLDIANRTSHLKSGTFTQLTCGTLPRTLNVPLGLFAMSDHRRLFAPVGRRITTHDIRDAAQLPVEQITTKQRLTYEDIKHDLPQRQLTVGQEMHVALGAIKNAMVARLQSSNSSN